MSTPQPLPAGASTSVTIENVHVSFGKTEVLRGINLEIQPGEFFAFLGPSGCGKSTLLRLIAGFGQAQQGCIRIGGKDITALPPWKRNVGMVFQSYALWPHLTVRDNVAFGLEQQRVPKDELDARVARALDLVGLGHYAARRPAQLSGGQQQRVALARTLVVEPQVLLLDEPLSNLDAKLRVQMRHEIRELQRKLSLTTIYVTHDQEEANAIADRMAILHDRVVQQVGEPLAMYDNPANSFVAQFLGVANVLEGSADGNVFRARGGLTFPLTAAGGGDVRRVMFRPQAVSIDHPGAALPAGWSRIAGQVRDAEFLGHLLRYRVAAGEEILLIDVLHQRGGSYFQPGASVQLGLDPGQIVPLHD